MPAPSPDLLPAESLTLLWLDDDAEYRRFVTDAIETVPDVEVITDDDPTRALQPLDGVDGVVTEIEFAGDVGEWLAAVRKHDPRCPLVIHTESPLSDIDGTALDADNVDYLRKDWEESTVRLLAGRVRSMVERNHFSDVAHRLTSAVDASRDPIVVVGPDGTIEYANGQFASAISPARTDLCGRHWTELFTEDSVEQLQHEAIPVGTDGWSWNGTAELAAGDDELSARVTLVRIDDGSKVFSFRNLASPV